MMKSGLSRIPMIAMLLGAMLFGSVLTGTAMAFQGHMWSARAGLQRSYNQLAAATPDKYGHREAAMNLVQQAISQVNQGIAAGAR